MYNDPASSALPRAFCWSRMGDEAGQGIATILLRKDLERRATGGTFVWGIGNALGNAMRGLIAREEHPQVLFSPIRSISAVRDRAPTGVLVWSGYIDEHGREVAM